MPRLDVDNVGAIGVIKDLPDSELPVNAFTDARNIRFDRGAARKFVGDQGVFEASLSLQANPMSLFPVQDETNYYWVYPSNTRIYVTNGDTHVDISQSATASMTYTTTDNARWNGGVLNGFAILNNGNDAPVYWEPGLGNNVEPLRYDYSSSVSWASATATPTAKVIRPFKEFLIAMDVTEGGVRNQRTLWWSHPAEAGDIPKTWDYTKSNFLAGQNELAETQGVLIDGLQLRNDFAIYKDDSIYRMSYTGLPNVFTFRKELETFGALSTDCVVPFFGRHLVLGNSDVVLHNFNEAQSILTNKMKRWLYSIISNDNYRRSFLLTNFDYNEVWICFPENAEDYPNLALIWNWETNSTTIRELDNIVCGANGIIDPTITTTSFDSTAGSFDTDFGTYGETAFNPTMTKTVIGQRSDTGSPHVLQVDETNQFNGTNMTAYVERVALPLGRQGGNGEIRIDTSQVKHITKVIPRIRASSGASINIYVGTQSELDGAVSWAHSGTFDCDNDYKHDCRVSGKILAIKFESTTNISWILDGYSIEWHYGGDR